MAAAAARGSLGARAHRVGLLLKQGDVRAAGDGAESEGTGDVGAEEGHGERRAASAEDRRLTEQLCLQLRILSQA